MQLLKNWLSVVGQFLSGLIFVSVVIGFVHSVLFYQTIFLDPNRDYVWHDWLSIFIGISLGILLGASMARDTYRRRFSVGIAEE